MFMICSTRIYTATFVSAIGTKADFLRRPVSDGTDAARAALMFFLLASTHPRAMSAAGAARPDRRRQFLFSGASRPRPSDPAAPAPYLVPGALTVPSGLMMLPGR
jgi:hypothetical protein